eukprot:Clim_evm100s243 gene=Clim_evmTU100s243
MGIKQFYHARAREFKELVERPEKGPITVHGLDEDRFSWRTFAAFFGPGMVISIAYIDPGNLLSDIISGAAYNYSLLWVLFVASAMALLLQILAARLGVVSRLNLAEACRMEYGERTFTTIGLWIMTEIVVVCCDIPEVIGSAFALKLLLGFPLWLGVVLTSLSTMMLLGLQAFGIRKIEAVIVVLIAIMGVCFIIEAGLSPVPWTIGSADCLSDEEWYATLGCQKGDDNCPRNYCGTVWSGFIPIIYPEQLFIAVSLVGAVVMPHNLYLHSALMQTRHVDHRSPVQVKWANFYCAVECAVGLVIGFIINAAVIIAAGAVFFPSEHNDYAVVNDVLDIGFLDAGSMLRESLGKGAKILFGIALLASGQSSTITGTFAGQFIMQGFLQMKLEPWKRNLITRTCSIIPSLIITILAGDQGANLLILISSIVLSFQLPFALIPLMKFTCSRDIMGAFTNKWPLTASAGFLSIVVVAANVYLIASTIIGINASKGGEIAIDVFALIVAAMYFGALIYLTWRPLSGNVKPITVPDSDLEESNIEGADTQSVISADDKMGNTEPEKPVCAASLDPIPSPYQDDTS